MTRLTVPVANTDPGRAARAVPVTMNTAGAEFAQLGETMAAVGNAVESDRLDRQMKRAQVDMTRDLNDLRLEVMQIGSPAEAARARNQGKARIRDSFVQPDAQGQWRVDPKNSERFGLAFDDLSNRHEFGLGARGIELRRAEREATFMAYSQEAVRAYATGDDEVRGATLIDLDAAVDEDVAAGRIDAAEGQRRKQEFRAEGDNARAIRMISADPRGFQDASAAGEFDNLPEGTRARYDAQASGAIAKMDDAALKAARKLAEERSKAIGSRLADMRKIAAKDFTAVDEAFLNKPEVQAHPDFAETRAQLALRDDGLLIAQAAPEQLEAAIDAERDRKITAPWEASRAEVLETALAKHRAGYSTDPIAYAAEQGRDVPPLPSFDPADPMAFGAAIADRVVFAEQDRAAGYTDTLRYLSNSEREQIKALAGVSTDPETRAALARTLTVSLSGASPDTVASFGFDPVFSYVGEMQVQTGNPDLAAEVFRGQQAIGNKNVVLPPLKDRLNPTFNAIKGFFGGQPNGQAKQAEITAAADALYAARMQQTDPGADIDETVYRQALHEVMGGTGAYGSRDALGGMQDVNGQLTPLPIGLGARQIDGAMIGLRRDLAGTEQNAQDRVHGERSSIVALRGAPLRPATKISPEEARARADARLQAASESGGAPGINGEPLDAGELEDYQLIPAGDGVYVMSIDGVAVQDLQTGGLWRFDLQRLVREYSR